MERIIRRDCSLLWQEGKARMIYFAVLLFAQCQPHDWILTYQHYEQVQYVETVLQHWGEVEEPQEAVLTDSEGNVTGVLYIRRNNQPELRGDQNKDGRVDLLDFAAAAARYKLNGLYF
jgi:hypothetical protein